MHRLPEGVQNFFQVLWNHKKRASLQHRLFSCCKRWRSTTPFFGLPDAVDEWLRSQTWKSFHSGRVSI